MGSSGCQAGTNPGQDALPSQGTTHTHTHRHSDWDNVYTPVHLSVHIFVMWEETRVPEKPHIDMERTCELHTDSDPGWESIFFFSSTL